MGTYSTEMKKLSLKFKQQIKYKTRGHYTNATVEKTCTTCTRKWVTRQVGLESSVVLRFAPSDFSDSQGFLRFVRQILKGP